MLVGLKLDIASIRAMAETAGWGSGVEVEILSKRWWAEDPDAVLGEIVARRALC